MSITLKLIVLPVRQTVKLKEFVLTTNFIVWRNNQLLATMASYAFSIDRVPRMKNIVQLDCPQNCAAIPQETYRTYSLVCTQDKDMCIGEVFKQGVRVAYCESLDLRTAQQHLRRIVDWHIRDAINLRNNATPDIELWCMATTQILFDASKEEKAILRKLSRQLEGYVSITELANLAKLSCTAELNFLLSDFARKVCDFIPYEPPYPGDGRDPYLALLCDTSLQGDSVRLTSVFSTILKNYRP